MGPLPPPIPFLLHCLGNQPPWFSPFLRTCCQFEWKAEAQSPLPRFGCQHLLDPPLGPVQGPARRCSTSTPDSPSPPSAGGSTGPSRVGDGRRSGINSDSQCSHSPGPVFTFFHLLNEMFARLGQKWCNEQSARYSSRPWETAVNRIRGCLPSRN